EYSQRASADPGPGRCALRPGAGRSCRAAGDAARHDRTSRRCQRHARPEEDMTMGRTDGGPVETIADLLATAADDLPALTDPAGTVLTYRQLRDQIAAVAEQLAGLGAQ